MPFIGKTMISAGRLSVFGIASRQNSESYVIFSMYLNKGSSGTIFFHLLFWIVYSISNAYLWSTFDRTYNETTFYGLTRLPIKIIAVYINQFLLMQLFFKKKYVVFICFFILNLIATGCIQTYISSSGPFNYQSFTQYCLPVCSVVIVSSVLIIIHQFFIKTRESKQLEIEKIKNELSFLKAQLQPHFLFNTLNNIYSLTLDNSQVAWEINPATVGLIEVYDLRVGNRYGRLTKRNPAYAGLY